ncbi:MAG: class B sortase [Clostridia bacterium]|nr:class B sortase [Clostridia bacterium]
MYKRRWLALLLACLLAFSAAGPAAQGEVQYTLDFEYLRHFAPNAVGWLYQPDTTIDHPVLFSESASYYLTRGYDGRRSRSGSVFMLGESMPDLADTVIVLRGKNNWDNSLFGSLSEYRSPEYYRKHPTLYLISPEGNYRLDVFAGVKARHTDKESWLVSEQAVESGEALTAVLRDSFLVPDAGLLPTEGDGWAILTTEDANDEGSRFVLYARKRPIPASDAPVVYMNQQGLDARESISGYATARGVGTWMVYGQNDPLWDRMIFEVPYSSRRRPFGDGGCGPTSIAIAIANLVPTEKLPQIREYASNPLGYVFCPCCIGTHWCEAGHLPYQLNTPEQYLRYFPLAVADFAMGNNTFGVQGRRDSYGTNMSYLNAICSVYGISVKSVRSLEDALPYLRRKDTMAISCVTGSSSPFTRNSHFLVLAHADNEYLYVLDPLRRESYASLDVYGVLELISPGLVRVKLENAHLCHFSTISLLTY